MSEVTATNTETATASSVAKAYLINARSNAKVHLNTKETLIGRETGLSYNGISRKHCKIRFEDGKYSVIDMNSKYGTFLNRQRLAPNQWQSLKPGDELRLGGTDFLLQSAAASRAVRESPKLKPVPPEATTGPEIAEIPTPAAGAEPEDTQELEHISLWSRARAEAVTSTLATILATILGALIQTRSLPVSLLESVFILSLVNYLPMFLTGQSLGKRFTGIKIVMEDGSPLALGTVLFRELLMKSGTLVLFVVALGIIRPINNMAFLVAFISAPTLFLWKTLHDGSPFWDHICGTRAINADDLEAE